MTDEQSTAPPAPLVPAEVDLRGLPWMRLDTSRLLDSDLFAISTGDEFKAAVSLWCKSWTQLPAASLPNDDRVLAHLSGAGARWKKLKAMALRGWVLCADGRLYHPVVAEQAVDAWEERVDYRAKQEASAERKKREREDRHRMFEELRALGHVLPWNTSTQVLRDTFEAVTNQSRVTGGDESHAGHGQVTAKTGQGERQGQGEGLVIKKSTGPNESDPPSGGKSPKKGDVLLDTWLATLDGADAIPATDSVFTWAADAGIPGDFLELSWFVFCARARDSKNRQKDWRQTYRNYVQKGYLKLWYVDNDGEYRLNTVGIQEQRVFEAQRDRTQDEAA